MTKDGVYLKDKDVLELVNTLYKMKPTEEFKQFMIKSSTIQQKTDSKIIQEIFRRGNALYDKYYQL